MGDAGQENTSQHAKRGEGSPAQWADLSGQSLSLAHGVHVSGLLLVVQVQHLERGQDVIGKGRQRIERPVRA